MAKATGQKDCVALVRPATDPKFGDYQVNGVMPLAKSLKKNPRQLAEEVLKNVDLSDICEQPEIAGPGFINLRLKPDFLVDSLLEINSDSQNRLGVDKTENPQTVVVDFSCPNIAKQMHVGHLRSTIIGDCICRTLEFLGHKVIRQNHVGDWGLQMGMVIRSTLQAQGFKEAIDDHEGKRESNRFPEGWSLELSDLEHSYRIISKREKEDQEVASAIRESTVQLQRGEKNETDIWKKAREITLKECLRLYHILSVTLDDEHVRGESFYKKMLPDIVKELQDKGCAKGSDGAICVFPPGFKNKEGDPLPFIIQKSDGAYLYATTDLAAIRYRANKLKADKIVYVTDARQKLHFEMLFAVGRLAGWAPEELDLVHVMFGSVQGQDGKPLKTREGESVKLKDLLDEAVQRAKAIVEEKNPDLSADEKNEIAKAVGIGAVKYADYSNNRTSDYIFSFDKMLAMDGNTAPYMQYAYARIKSIERKAESREVDIETELAGIKSLNLTEPAELELAKHLIRYGEAIQSAAADYRPNYLTGYLYELAQKFSSFYTDCPVLKAPPDKRPTRLLLCDLTCKTIRQGLSELLGIEVVEQM